MALARVRYAARRGLEVIPTLFFVSIVVGLIRLAPGDPAAMKMGREAARPENKPKLEALRHEMGLDRPIPVQYVLWLNDLAHGNFDTWLRSKRPTLDLFLQKLPATVELVIVATLFALFVSLPLGVIAGYRGGALDSLLMRTQDALFAFPAVLFAILVVAAIGASKTSIILTIGVSYPPRLARLVRGNMMLLKHEDFVTASRASGSGDGRLIWRHILPNCFATIMVQVTLAMAVAILIEAGLSYLGLGVQPPITTWGTMKAAQSYPDQAPWYVLAPGICIFAVVLALNTLGDVLRDRLDPRLRRLKKEFAMPLADRLATYEQSRRRGVDFLLRHLNPDGSPAETHPERITYCRLPSALEVSGETAAARVLGWIAQTGFGENGPLHGGIPRSSDANRSFNTYPET